MVPVKNISVEFLDFTFSFSNEMSPTEIVRLEVRSENVKFGEMKKA